ncbi:MAG: insecticidal toxin complex protein [Deltaproteobacteria bacterium]|nr:MAG: insecticidal toxin complex protein [Deltaproteobacteria bacterium]
MKTNKEEKDTAHEFLRNDRGKSKSNTVSIPTIELPKGGGAIKGIDEKFSVNPTNGTASFSIPLPFSNARANSPALNLTYNSGAGNGIFGLGWNLSLASIKRKTDKKLPRYLDSDDTDIFLFSEAEDLVVEFAKRADGSFIKDTDGTYVIREETSQDDRFLIRYYRPRIEGLFARIERWQDRITHRLMWRVITRDNNTLLFGWSDDAVIADPADPGRIYEWLLEFSFDDKGNCNHYLYKKEDDKGFDAGCKHNSNRRKKGNLTYTNCYLERVLYGNKTPYAGFNSAFPPVSDYMFQTVFDYGEYEKTSPFDKTGDWQFRSDAFSSYKPGFEVRTTRLCNRVLLFHYFNELPGGAALVRSLDFTFDNSQGFALLQSATSTGYIKKPDGSYSQKSLPKVEFTYQAHAWNSDVKSISPENLAHAPAGVDERDYQFTDLYNEGLSGILTEQAGGWYYKSNQGGGRFSPAMLVSPKPSFAGLGQGLQLLDLDADGGKQLVNLSYEPKGYFELSDEEQWQPFQPFRQTANIDLEDPNSRLLDLNGDGRADVLITEDHILTWHEAKGREGYGAAQKTINPPDEEAGPHIVFADAGQSIFLADMSGDGLTDIVRIRNGEVCYWPNLGYGRFGAKINFDNAPWFDAPDIFNPDYLRLADIDGSGTTDIIYLGNNTFSCWLNLSGNAFADTPFTISSFPDIHTHARITVTDLLGNGVACIVWSSDLAKDSSSPLRYIDLMSSKKPHILIGYKNNLGQETTLEYTPSTTFYLDDKKAGKPWITKLHFPVHCLSRTETRDLISGYRFVSSYTYHHGYYDHAEREFRGFGMVEQTDSEIFDHWVKSDADNIVEQPLHQAPMVSRSWFHTGAFFTRENILDQFAGDYWYAEMQRQGFTVVNLEKSLPEARLIAAPGIDAAALADLDLDEWRQALRACKGMNLRSESFANDAPASNPTPEQQQRALTPYSVASRNCVIELLQPKGQNPFAVFVVKESEAITYTYERHTDDPRIAHTLNVKLDEYGNILESASVVYPRIKTDTRLPPDVQQAQDQVLITYSRNGYTNDIASADACRLRLLSETASYELRGVAKSGPLFTVEDFDDILEKSQEIEYHQLDSSPATAAPQKRLIEHVVTLYRSNNLTSPLPLHKLESLALPYESYQLAYTPDLLADIYADKADVSLMLEGKFTQLGGDGNWWIRSGTTQYIEAAENAVHAQQRFYLPVSYIDPYGARSIVRYYGEYHLFIEEIEDALANTHKVEQFNFRTLGPRRIQDANGNFTEVLVDELGLVKAMAVFGKGDEADDLIGLDEFTDDSERALIDDFFQASASDVLVTQGKELLQHATARFVYDLDSYKNSGNPCVVASILREEHFIKNTASPVQLSFEYSNGLGQVVMQKAQAEPGRAKQVTLHADGSYSVTEIDTAAQDPKQLRWLGNGRTVLNNKGKPVKQYEPYFSVTHHFEDRRELVESGVTPLMYYDAPGRLIKTELPDGTFSRTEFDSWQQAVFDTNDTVLESRWYAERSNHLIDARLLAAGKDPDREKAAAEQAAKHADTPSIQHFDTLGRPILSVEHNRSISNGADEYYFTRAELDIESNLRSVTDARGNRVMRYKYDMLGNAVYQHSMDAGQRWLLINVVGNPLRTWDERNHEFQYFYDILHRPTHSVVIGGDGETALDHIFERIFYGEDEPDPHLKNLRGQVVRHYDTGGMIEMPEYDFKGQALSASRRLFKDYKGVANWQDANLTADLESEIFTSASETDALGRITRQTAPDGSIITPQYNKAGLLNAEIVQHQSPNKTTNYIKNIDYNEKGQRNRIVYGNDVTVEFTYDKETFRLIRLQTQRNNSDPLQDWQYTFDPLGNITHIEDKNIPVVFFDNQKITGVSQYTYDALYRLVSASGRENATPLAFDSQDNWNDAPFLRQYHPGDPMAMRTYTQTYQYDGVGNILQMRHRAAGNAWVRNYTYQAGNNRLDSTQSGANTYRYPHHAQHGFMTKMPHLQEMGWNFKEELVKTIRQRRTDGGIPQTTYYQYDGQGQRIRKITENTADPGAAPTKKDERIYIGGYEIYKKHSGNDAGLERSSLSLMDGQHRFVMIETETKPRIVMGISVGRTSPRQTVRYQLHNHLGSAALELDENAEVISYEEYHPFGTTAFQAKNASIKAAAKRYRYTGMERDKESGLEYHSARYYLPWLGRWGSCDPLGIEDGINLYRFVNNNPVLFVDLEGKQYAKLESLYLARSNHLPILETTLGPDAVGVDIDLSGGLSNVIGGRVIPLGFSFVLSRGGSLDVYYYAGGAVSIGEQKGGSLAINISPFAAWYTGDESQINDKSWTGEFESIGIGGDAGIGPKYGFGGAFFWSGNNELSNTLPFAEENQWMGVSLSFSGGYGIEGSIAGEFQDTYYWLLTPDEPLPEPESVMEMPDTPIESLDEAVNPQLCEPMPQPNECSQVDEPLMTDFTDPANYSNYYDYASMQDPSISEEELMSKWALVHGWSSVVQQ